MRLFGERKLLLFIHVIVFYVDFRLRIRHLIEGLFDANFRLAFEWQRLGTSSSVLTLLFTGLCRRICSGKSFLRSSRTKDFAGKFISVPTLKETEGIKKWLVLMIHTKWEKDVVN